MEFVATIAGLAALFIGGESLVRGAVSAARALGVSRLLIGLTVVAASTSSPELLVSLRAAVDGHPDIAVGNVVGSNIANIALVLGLCALIAPIRIAPHRVRPDVAASISGALAIGALAVLGRAPVWAGALLLAAGVTHTAEAYQRSRSEGSEHDDVSDEIPSVASWPGTVLRIAGGIALLALGADWLVWGAQRIASDLGVPEAAIAVTLVAVGTSLPEIATSIVAAVRGHGDVAVGNAIGSNVFNIFGVLGLTAAIAPVPVSQRFFALEVPVLLAFSAVVWWALCLRGRLGRVTGSLLMLAYAAYAAASFMR
ncbi:MAG: calcium/sodium antiporter [Coriobacteriia bacterium]|nr:calcium/sodium antiporter [Coriobacteriia bacterium]